MWVWVWVWVLVQGCRWRCGYWCVWAVFLSSFSVDLTSLQSSDGWAEQGWGRTLSGDMLGVKTHVYVARGMLAWAGFSRWATVN